MLTNHEVWIDLTEDITRDHAIRLIEEILKARYGDSWHFQPIQGIERPRVADTKTYFADGVCSTGIAEGHRLSVESSLTQALVNVAQADAEQSRPRLTTS